jgi:hypothetical protein
MDKRNTPIFLPFQVDGTDLGEVVAQHWNITSARQGKYQ